MNIEKWINQNTESLRGKNVAITGSTGGLGKEICAHLASLGATLILLDRSPSRSQVHRDSLVEKFGTKVVCVPLDLENISEADGAISTLVEIGVDIFIHNAGAYSIPRKKCSSGYDNVFQINYATPYYIIRSLIPHFEERVARVVIVGSIAHNYSKINTQDIDFSSVKPASKVYGNAKRHLMFATYELMKAHGNIHFSVVHPGITFTNITAHYPKLIFAIIKHPMKIIFMKPKIAALSIIKGVFDPCGECEWIGPRFFDVWGMPKKRILRTCSTAERDKIAEIAEEVYGVCKSHVECQAKE